MTDPMVLTERDIVSILEQRKSAFNLSYWTNHNANQTHYDLVKKTKSPFDFRLLYDSWLWRCVLETATPRTPEDHILELLPGTSLTIPVALQSTRYKGVLSRMDDVLPAPLPEAIQFREQRIAGQLSDFSRSPLLYDAIVGNHIIDDLLFNLHYPNPEERKRIYYDAQLCKAAWKSMAESGCLSQHRVCLVNLFVDVVLNMKCSSTLILRHYPSTFALASNDLVRINAEMEAYFSVTDALSAYSQWTTSFFDTSSVSVAPGSTYPKTIFVLQKAM